MNSIIKTQVVVLGAGPAGYSSAFRCSDLGFETIIVERYDSLGGVCLNVGCIPSKSLLHIAKVLEEAKSLASLGVIFDEPKINFEKICSWKEKVISKLANGLLSIAQARKVKIIHGIGKFIDSHTLEVKDEKGKIIIDFEYAIIAVGSRPIQLPCILYNDDQRIWNSTDALKLKEVPKRMLIIGGGIIGLEIGTIYYTLGSKIDIVEVCDQVIPSADRDVINVFTKYIRNKFNLALKTEIISVEPKKDGIYVLMKSEKMHSRLQRYDVVLVAVGRVPNGNNISADRAGIKIDDRGFIYVDKQMRTNIANIFAIGDVVGQPMLAHKGIHEGHIAAEVIAGMNHYFDSRAIPSIAYTDPEVAWVGLTEKEAKEKGINFETATFSWSASGRVITSNRSDGITKLIFNKDTRCIIGGAVVGTNGGELLGEIGLAIEMGCDVEDISLTIHAHPTLSESIGLTAKIFEGSITDLLNIKTRAMKK